VAAGSGRVPNDELLALFRPAVTGLVLPVCLTASVLLPALQLRRLEAEADAQR
jgi:hypothetical protein